eukprot:7934654-Alexandrium_andersonii.AAC.1
MFGRCWREGLVVGLREMVLDGQGLPARLGEKTIGPEEGQEVFLRPRQVLKKALLAVARVRGGGSI